MNNSLKNCRGFLVAVVAMALLFGVGHAQAGWTSLDYPGASDTFARGIDGGKIVGNYRYSGGPYRGFVYDGTNWTSLDYPGADWTVAAGIDGDNIVGYFGNAIGWHGFVYDGVNWTTLDCPGADWTHALDIDAGNIIGHYIASGDQAHGFVYDGTTWTTLDYPGAEWTEPKGIGDGNIVGTFLYVSGKVPYHAFVYDGTSWTSFDYPGGSEIMAKGIDGGNIVGYYTYASIDHGFIYDGTTWTTLDYPGADRTFANGIDGGNIVGQYYFEGAWHGFLYETEPPCWPIDGLIDIDPDTLNKKSHGRWVTVYITLPDGYDVGAIDTTTVGITSLTGVSCSPSYTQSLDLSFTPQVGDRDEDGIPDLTAKFDRQMLLPNLCLDDVGITVEGDLTTGRHFSGSDTIRIIDRGR